MKLFDDNKIDENKENTANEEKKYTIDEYIKLRDEIEKHNSLYYNEDKPIISDFEYDKLVKKLDEIEKSNKNFKEEYNNIVNNRKNNKENNEESTVSIGLNENEIENITKNINIEKEIVSPTEKIGGSASEKFSKVEHRVPMLSLSNTYNIGEIKDFDQRVKKIIGLDKVVDYILELKLDGLSISLIYENGILTKGITRGDGMIGEDVTENIMEIDSIPKKLKSPLNIEVRGEVILPISNFNKVNEIREEAGEDVFANPRNAAAGTIRQLDSSIVSERGLDCYIYYLVNANEYNINSHIESIEFIKSLGFKTTNVFEIYSDFEKLEKAIEKWNSQKEKLDFETDGLVIKVNEFKYYNILGYTTKSPRWAIAYKFKAEQVKTKIYDITFQVGRTGVITPVAELEAVNLSGSVVRRASLHNFDEIKRKDIKIGDSVIIEKAAEIIPQVVSVVIDDRDGTEKAIEIPQKCPICNSKLEKEEGQVALKCLNSECPEKVKREIEYFVSRDAMNIMGLGEKIVERFIELRKIKNIVDIYSLKDSRDELEKLEKMGKKSIDNLINNIEDSKNRDFSKVFYALGIPFVGKYTANLLTKTFKNIDTLKEKTIEELLEVKGIGEKVANSVNNYLNDKNNWEKIEKLKNIGLKFEIENIEKVEIQDNPIKDKNFLATGKLEKYKREDIKNIILSKGGNYLSGVSKNLDFLIAGEKAGSKLTKAEQLGIRVLSEEEFEREFLD